MVIPRLIKKVKTEKKKNSGVSDLISGKEKIHRKVENKKIVVLGGMHASSPQHVSHGRRGVLLLLW